MNKTSKNLRELRAQRGLQNADIAEATGIAEEKLFLIETEQVEATYQELKSLAKFYDKDVTDFYMKNISYSSVDEGYEDDTSKANTVMLIFNILTFLLLPVYAAFAGICNDLAGAIICLVSEAFVIVDMVDSIIMATNARFTKGRYARVSAIIRLITGIILILSLVAIFAFCIATTTSTQYVDMINYISGYIPIKNILMAVIACLLSAHAYMKFKFYSETKSI